MKPTLEEIKDNYERVLLQLENGHLAGIRKFSRSNIYGVVEKCYWNGHQKAQAIELGRGYKRESVNGFNIDAIAFMSNKSEVSDAIEFGCDEDIDWDWDINNPQCNDQMDAYEYAISTRTDWADILLDRNLIDKKGDNNNMEEITEIYMDRKLKKINDKFENLIENKKLNDERYKTFKQCINTLDKLYKEDKVLPLGHYKDINLSEQTLKDIEFLEKMRFAEKERVEIKIYEVRAQLKMCETYDQKQEILRRYNIINKNGKVNA